jgi:hypothetical protein
MTAVRRMPMPAIEPHNIAESQDQAPQDSRKAYHSPEFRDYGTVGDLTRTSPPINPVEYDAAAPYGYINLNS